MSEFLPLFPLNIVVFPGEVLNLHIFEERYKQLIKECIENKWTFGIPFFSNGVKELGTEIQVDRIVNIYENGEIDISTRGIRVFKIIDFFPVHEGKLYAAGSVEFLGEDPSEDQTVRTKILDMFQQLISVIAPGKDINHKDNAFLSYKVGHHLAMTKEQEFELISLRNESERQLYILDHLQRIMPLVLEMENLKDRIKQNGHFKALSVQEEEDH